MTNTTTQLKTTCSAELWAGFFGTNPNGDQPECGCEIIENVEHDSIEYDKDGSLRPAYAVQCPQCGHLIEWPHNWEINDKGDK